MEKSKSVEIRKCDNCLHYRINGEGKYGCDTWECKYEPELKITKDLAIEYLRQIGWLKNHDQMIIDAQNAWILKITEENEKIHRVLEDIKDVFNGVLDNDMSSDMKTKVMLDCLEIVNKYLEGKK